MTRVQLRGDPYKLDTLTRDTDSMWGANLHTPLPALSVPPWSIP